MKAITREMKAELKRIRKQAAWLEKALAKVTGIAGGVRRRRRRSAAAATDRADEAVPVRKSVGRPRKAKGSIPATDIMAAAKRAKAARLKARPDASESGGENTL